MEGLIEGRMVHYVLAQHDVAAIKANRENGPGIGNAPTEGDHVPMIVARVWPTPGCVNGQAILDGNDAHWVTSARFDESGAPGTWHWIERT